MKRKVCLFVGGFPSEDNPAHGVFNLRAAQGLAPLVDLTVVQLRMWLPKRKFKSVSQHPDGFKLIVLCIPFIPKFENALLNLNSLVIAIISSLLLAKERRQFEVVHSVSTLTGIVPALWPGKQKFVHVVQSIGADLNSEMPVVKNSWAVKKLLKSIDSATFNSKQLLSQYESLLGKAPHSRIIYRGVNVDKFTAQPFPKEESISFLFIGGLPAYPNFVFKDNTKGGKTLMEAWKQIDAMEFQLRPRLVFAGPESVKPESEMWRKSLRYPESVEMPGVIKPADLQKRMAESAAVIVPSMEEGLPNAGMEAAASARMLIATPVGGIPEITRDRETALIFPAGNANELAKCLEEAIRNPETTRQRGEKARELMVLHFRHTDFAPQYASLYEELINLKKD